MPTRNYTKEELAEHAIRAAAQSDTSQHGNETQGQINSRLARAAENLRAFMNTIGQRHHDELVAKHAAPKVTPFTPE